MGYTPHVLVVGGGATGTAAARDLAMRGLDVTLVERGTLAGGTSGSMHALLHSGARYAVDDPETAARCRRENAILRDVAGHLVTETGGLFVRRPDDPAGYVERKRAACEEVGIPVTELSGDEARERESALADDVADALGVPDAVIDPFRLCRANARAAVRHGADLRTHTSVVSVERDGDAVGTVRLRNEDPDVSMLADDKVAVLDPDYVVNAAGPWAGDVAAMAGLDVPVRHSQGAMLAVERAGLGTVVNRCRPRTEGDIAVPFGATSVLGTTDRPVDGPGAVDRTVDEVDFLVDELAELVPTVASARPYRAYWGVRALPADGHGDGGGPDDGSQPGDRGDGDEVGGDDADERGPTTEAARSYTLLDHEVRDDCWGLTTVYGGKLTTSRLVAEQVADQVCAKFGIDRPCRTDEVALPGGPTAGDEGRSGGPPEPDPVLCEAVGVSRRAVRTVLDDGELPAGSDLQSVVQRTRAAMGYCQGGRCAHRLSHELFPDADADATTRAFADLARERWAGLRYALWGEQLATAARTYDLHRGTMNRDGLPDAGGDRIAYDEFDAGSDVAGRPTAGSDDG